MHVPLSAASAIVVAFAVAMALALDVPKAAELAAWTTPVCPTAREAPIAAAAACRHPKPDVSCQVSSKLTREAPAPTLV